jgi:hypothetical protein
MKEEELKRKYDIHINIYISEHKHEEQQTIKNQNDNGVRQSRLRLQAFVLVGEAFLFPFKDLNVHPVVPKRLQTDLVLFYKISRTQQN